jgi:hypothetical protein
VFAHYKEPKSFISGFAVFANILHVLALHLGIMTVLFIACERLWATLRSDGYEYRSAKIACSLLAIEVNSLGFSSKFSFEAKFHMNVF